MLLRLVMITFDQYQYHLRVTFMYSTFAYSSFAFGTLAGAISEE